MCGWPYLLSSLMPSHPSTEVLILPLPSLCFISHLAYYLPSLFMIHLYLHRSTEQEMSISHWGFSLHLQNWYFIWFKYKVLCKGSLSWAIIPEVTVIPSLCTWCEPFSFFFLKADPLFLAIKLRSKIYVQSYMEPPMHFSA